MILCKECRDKTEQTVERMNKEFPDEPPEYINSVCGSARRDFICDQCNIGIAPGAICWAISLWTDIHPYHVNADWEKDYVTEIIAC